MEQLIGLIQSIVRGEGSARQSYIIHSKPSSRPAEFTIDCDGVGPYSMAVDQLVTLTASWDRTEAGA